MLVENRIREAINDARRLSTEAVQKLELQALGQQNELAVTIVSGSCGGTGSGCFLDVAGMVRRIAAEAGIPGVSIRALVVMPTFFVDIARRLSPSLMARYKANGYAFFKELHHFCLKPEDFPSALMEALALKAKKALPVGSYRPADYIYLIDNDISGTLLESDRAAYDLSADALFQIAATQAGDNAARVEVNEVPLLLENETAGRKRCFSSLGLSYIVCPARSISRLVVAQYLDRILLTRFLAIDKAIEAKAQEEARRLLDVESETFDPVVASRRLTRACEANKSGLPTKAKLLEDRNGPYQAMQQGQIRVSNLISRVTSLVTEELTASKDERAERLRTRIDRLIDCGGGAGGVAFARSVLEALRTGARASGTTQASGGEVPGKKPDIDPATRLSASLNVVQKLTQDHFPNVLQGRAIGKNLDQFSSSLTDWYALEMRRLSKQCTDGIGNDILLAVDEGIGRCDSLVVRLTAVSNLLRSQWSKYDPAVDEGLVLPTTQFIPGNAEALAKEIVERMSPEIDEDSKQLMSQIAAGSLFSKIVASDARSSNASAASGVRKGEQDPTGVLLALLIEWVCNKPEIQSLLKKTIKEAALDHGKKRFQTEVLNNLLKLADPTWSYRADKVADYANNPAFPVSDLSVSDDMQELLDGQPILRTIAGEPSPSLNVQRMQLLRAEHALPLHAMVSMPELAGAYTAWGQGGRGNMPVHVDRTWEEDRSKLVDVMPGATIEERLETLFFALGLFTQWLISDSGQGALADGLVKGHQAGRGYVWQVGGGNRFRAVLVKMTDKNELKRVGERTLNASGKGGRTEALMSFNEECRESMILIWEQIERKFDWRNLKALLDDYCLNLQRQRETAVNPDFKRQLELEEKVVQGLISDK